MLKGLGLLWGLGGSDSSRVLVRWVVSGFYIAVRRVLPKYGVLARLTFRFIVGCSICSVLGGFGCQVTRDMGSSLAGVGVDSRGVELRGLELRAAS